MAGTTGNILTIVSDEIPKLRMTPRTTTDELVERIEREKRAAGVQREMSLEKSLADLRRTLL